MRLHPPPFAQLAVVALLFGGCAMIPPMEGGASSITGDFTPEEAAEIMEMKRIRPADRITTRSTGSSNGRPGRSRVVHQRHWMTQRGHLYGPTRYLDKLRAEGIATDLKLFSESPSYVPIYVGSSLASLGGLTLWMAGTIEENKTMALGGQALTLVGIGGTVYCMVTGIMDMARISPLRKRWAAKWNADLAAKLGLEADPALNKKLIFIGSVPIND